MEALLARESPIVAISPDTVSMGAMVVIECRIRVSLWGLGAGAAAARHLDVYLVRSAVVDEGEPNVG